MKDRFKHAHNILITLLLVLSWGCGNSLSEEKDVVANYKILILSDVHISNDETKDNRLAEMIDSINSGKFTELDMIAITGDLVSSFYSNRNEGDSVNNNRAKKLIKILSKSKLPVYLALGNHDYKIDGDKDSDAPFSFEEISQMESLWEKFADLKPYFAIEHKNWNYIFLNSMRGRYLERAFDDDQINWYDSVLSNGKPSLVFFHHPIKTDNFRLWCKPKDLIGIEKEPQFFKVTEKYKDQIKGIFVGHGHMWVSDVLFDTIPVHETDSFADNEKSPYHLIGIDTVENKITALRKEFIE